MQKELRNIQEQYIYFILNSSSNASYTECGMGVLEYQAMPSLRDAALTVLCTFRKKTSPQPGK
jgi:hypothetical protein